MPLAVPEDGEGPGGQTDRQTDRQWWDRRRAIVVLPCTQEPLSAEPGSPQKNSLVKAFRCFMNKLDSTYSIINLLYSDGLRGRLSCA